MARKHKMRVLKTLTGTETIELAGEDHINVDILLTQTAKLVGGGDATKYLDGSGNFSLPGTSGLNMVTVALTSAQILKLKDTPVEIIPTPGLNKIIIPTFIMGVVTGGTTTYTGVQHDTGLYLGNIGWQVDYNNGEEIIATALHSSLHDINYGAPFYNFIAAASNGQPLVLKNTSANPAGGDLTISITVHYLVVDIS
jgi:hypothetical protein